VSDRNDFNAQVIEEFRANGGKVGGMFANSPMMLLTTTGAKTGQRRTTPLVYTTDGDRVVVIASKGGAPTNPAWFHNVVANPDVTAEIGTETFEARAIIPDRAERDRLFDAQAAIMPGFRDYQEKTDRIIPVIVLKRKS
jgi:deazaflavin-dependent oxidoreductase (nitroreductase family)